MGVLVSICCTTYNHSKYIRDALDGFLMQKTDFDFEIIIHDDASSDNTNDIIREYEKKYPDMIKPIYQKTNKYSLGEEIFTNYLLPKVRGKYIALCEGDDYWSNPLKLHIQIDYMRNHPECSMVAHAVNVVKEDNKMTGQVLRYSLNDETCSTNELIKSIGKLSQTSSYLFRKRFIDKAPSWYLKSSVGDYPLVMLMATKGEIYYINNPMSCYRTGVIDSWTNRTHKDGNILASKIKQLNNEIETLKEFDKETNCMYSKEIILGLKPREFRLTLLQGKYKELRDKKYDLYKKNIGFLNLYKIYLKNIFIKARTYYFKLKSNIKKQGERLSNAKPKY